MKAQRNGEGRSAGGKVMGVGGGDERNTERLSSEGAGFGRD